MTIRKAIFAPFLARRRNLLSPATFLDHTLMQFLWLAHSSLVDSVPGIVRD
jgi:hypothetical protein